MNMGRSVIIMLLCGLAGAGAALGGGQCSFYAQGPTARKAVSLSFDDGPGPHTPQVLAVLAEKNVHATFFLEGELVRLRPDTVRAVHAAGHELGSHTYAHRNFYAYKGADRERVLEEDIRRTDEAVRAAAGMTPRLLRMPHGYAKAWARAVCARTGHVMVNWTFGCDWERMSGDALYQAYAAQIRPGAIFLMHDGGVKRQATLEALPRLIDEIRRRGYEIVTAGELLGIGGEHAGTGAAQGKH